MGFQPGRWEELVVALKNHARTGILVNKIESRYGTRYSIDRELETPDGRIPRPKIRTVWIEESNLDEWRLITAHPV